MCCNIFENRLTIEKSVKKKNRALTRILKMGVKMKPSRNSWSFTIHLYWDFSKSWSQIQKVGVNYSKFGVNESSENNENKY